MKNNLTLIFTLFFLASMTKGQDISYPDSWGKNGFSVERETATDVRINFSITDIYLDDLEVEGETMQVVRIPDVFLFNDEGAPDLPGTGRYIALPQGAVASLKVTASRTEKLENILVSPAPRIPLETENGPVEYKKNARLYSRDAFYPAEPVKLSHPDKIRGVDVVMLGITPFQYNPVTRELIIYRDIQVEITFEGGNGHFGEDRLRSRWFDPILSDALLNWPSMPEIDYSKPPQPSDTPDWEYIIITPNDPIFIAWADSLKRFRTLQGIRTGVVTTTEIGGNTTSAIENYVNTAFNTWAIPPVAVLLLGDYGTSGSTVVSPIYNSYCVSDNIYADVTGNMMPDITFARMTAQNATHLQTMVTKVLNYERNPPTSAYFYAHPVTALGWQTERWFQICSETVGGFWKHVQGKTPTRINAIYSGTPGSVWSTATNTSTVVNYFGPSGLGYIPATPAELGGWSGGNATMVNNAINSGCFMLQHRDHGGETGWGEPAYNNSNINGLTNTELTFVWSVNCLTGKYNYSSEVFAEKFHRYTYNGQNSGALGIVAASEVSYSFVNDTYVWGAYDNMWPDFMPAYGSTPAPRGVLPAFANSAGKYFLQQSSWPYNTSNKAVTYNLFHHHGDAFSTVYSEVPQNLTVVHNPILYAGVTTFDVQANVGALIALTVNGEIIGTATGTGAPVSITIPGQTPPDQVLVTVTLQNYFRYTSLVDVIPPTGPYVVRKSYIINDVAGGNGNGLMDYGETNLLTLEVENVGVQAANNVIVTLSTTDPYITITDGTQFYGTIAAGGTLSVTDGFAYDVANTLPDGHNASFEVSATDGTNTWLSYFSIPGHAPVLEYVDFTLADPSGNNNGKWDPGETVQITVQVENTGSSEAYNVMGYLTESDPYITVSVSQGAYGNIPGGSTASVTFTADASSSTPAGHMVNFSFTVNADMGITGSSAFSIVVGQVPVLILDLDDNANSSPAMMASITANGVAYDYTTSFPPDLNLYSSVFVCLGIYSNNHVLTSTEGQTLANYLNNGGMIYMEGGDTWYYDPQTAVHPMFKINDISDGSGDMGTVLGQTGTFTEGMSFQYSGENNWMDHIEAFSPAFKILQNQSPSYGTGVAYDAGTYKTIGTGHEFGGLNNGAFPSTRDELMKQYLDFFGLLAPPVPPGPKMDIKVFLEGPFNGSSMNVFLNVYNYIPLSQPFNTYPWYYTGTESVTAIPNADIVEWVLLELRETSGSASTATGSTMVAQQAGFIDKNGNVLATDGTSLMSFNITITQNLYAVIWHRNHLAVMSNYPLQENAGIYSYDFTTGADKAYGGFTAHKQIATGVWGMVAGDGNSNSQVTSSDKIDVWAVQAGQSGYNNGDFDMNGTVDNADKVQKWAPNAGMGGQVPDQINFSSRVPQ
ncbi:MAG: hypothetical protein JW861_04815 [Bacteroidales bacterium]|nr:hypothetical protein [Bacteroidales bacterium]